MCRVFDRISGFRVLEDLPIWSKWVEQKLKIGVFFIFVKLSKSYGKILGKGNLNLVQFVLKLHTFSGMHENPIFRNPTHHYTVIWYTYVYLSNSRIIFEKLLCSVD